MPEPLTNEVRRAWSQLTITKADDEQGLIEGIATTPTTDRMGDIVEPKGAVYNLPIPMLWQHKSDQPIGHVIKATVTDKGIAIVAKIRRGVLPEIDRAWTLIKEGLVRGLSIGFSPKEYAFMDDGGVHFLEWNWLELSAVTIPANMDATIQNIKSHDVVLPRPVSGAKSERVVARLITPGVPGSSGSTHPSKGTQSMKTIKEQIQGFEATRAAKVARMEELVKTAAESGATFDDPQKEEYDTLRGEVKAVDEHLVILRDHEKTIAASAQPADPRGDAGAASAGGTEKPGERKPATRIELKKGNLQPGIGFARYAMCLHQAKGNPAMASQLAALRGYKDTSPDVFNVLQAQAQGWDVKNAITGGSTSDATWASPLAQYTNLASEFVDYLRPRTVLGRLQGLRQVPFMVKIPRQTAGASGYWVGEQGGKPLSKLAFDSIQLGPTKMATIVVISDELARVSSPSAEAVVRDDLAAALAQFADQQLLSPGVASVANTNPASLTFGLTPVTSASAGGTSSIANVYTDVKAAFAGFFAANIDTTNAVWIMHPNTALALATMQTTTGQAAFPDVTFQGGTFMGLPVLVSGNVVYSTSGGAVIVLLTPNDIVVADDGGVTIDVSNEASLQMSDTPTGAAASLVSMFQTNQIAIRAERYINYAARRTAAVSYIDAAHY